MSAPGAPLVQISFAHVPLYPRIMNQHCLECEEESRTHVAQSPAGSGVGGRNMEMKSETSSNETVEWTMGVKTSKPKMSIKLVSSVCNDDGPCTEDEHEHDCDNNYGPSTVYAKVEASQKDILRGKDKETAAAQTEMPSTKPKANTLIASRQLIDGNELASVRDQCPLAILTLQGSVIVPRTLPKASVQGKASALHDAAIAKTKMTNKLFDINSEESKKQYYKDLGMQVEERKQKTQEETRRNSIDEKQHNETMVHALWGMPGSGAPNYHLGTVRRTKSLYIAGILPQEQLCDKGYNGLDFYRL
ncbi:uncharacterized protein LOC113164503 isoform X2 [Anabas testudineus]|uniref:uncharacterized protein LOC113164503 isoform X2 n=1 Tax=Anabas testudineus TaxID=64144 RepID=UPI000E45B89A|nr:uncharacterized protein LOC113164503 isoform X2 [Anabas testudineus]